MRYNNMNCRLCGCELEKKTKNMICVPCTKKLKVINHDRKKKVNVYQAQKLKNNFGFTDPLSEMLKNPYLIKIAKTYMSYKERMKYNEIH